MAENRKGTAGGPMGHGPRGGARFVHGKKVENPGKILKRVAGLILKHYTPHVIAVIICIILSVAATVNGTLFLRTLIDEYITPLIGQENPDFAPLLAAIMRMACIYAVGVVSTFVHQKLMIYVSQGTLMYLRSDIYEKMEKLPIRYFDTHAHGDIMSVYTNDIDTLRQMISQSMPQILNSSITVVSVTISMIMLSIPLTLVTFAMLGVILFSSAKLAGLSGKSFAAQQSSIGALNGFVEEMVEGQKVIKVFCHEEECKIRFKELNDTLFRDADTANKYANMMPPVNAQLGHLSYVLCAIIGGIMALGGFGDLTIGQLASFLQFNKSFSMPISQVSMQFNSIIMALAGAERIFKLMDEEPEKDEGYVTLVNVKESFGEAAQLSDEEALKAGEEAPEKHVLTETDEKTGNWAWKHTHQADGSVDYVPLRGDVRFLGVDFGYVPEKTVLHDIQLYAKPGQKIAFVGSTGAGKTTITNLINRFYDIQDGKIRYDGININKIKKSDLRRSLGIVLQETNLFTGTVMENIRYGNLDATDEEVIAAAKIANADSFIRRLSDGYNTVLKGNGSNLSQGQRQLLAIARAAVADPPVLILDEATSSIDTRTEKLVQAGMDNLMAGRTTFVIAHRLSTVKNSDCIVVLEQGRIIEKGTHEELLELKGRYYQLYTGNSISA